MGLHCGSGGPAVLVLHDNKTQAMGHTFSDVLVYIFLGAGNLVPLDKVRRQRSLYLAQFPIVGRMDYYAKNS